MGNNAKQGLFSGGSGKPKENKPCGFCNKVRQFFGVRPMTGQQIKPPRRYPNA